MINQTQSLTTFNFETSSVRVIAVNNEPWFVAVDLCNTLGIANSRDALSKLDDDEKTTVGLTDSQAGKGAQSLSLVSESGMYTLILRCRDAVKKGSVSHRFRKWVTSEVLPQIRKTGRYSQAEQLALPEPEKTYTHEFTEYEIKSLAWCFFIMQRNVDTFRRLHPALEAIQSDFAPRVYGQGYEYNSNIRRFHEIIERMTKAFDTNGNDSWHILKYIKEFDPTMRKLPIA